MSIANILEFKKIDESALSEFKKLIMINDVNFAELDSNQTLICCLILSVLVELHVWL